MHLAIHVNGDDEGDYNDRVFKNQENLIPRNIRRINA